MNYAFDEFELDATRLELRRAGKPLKADAVVLRLLRALVQRPGQLVSKRELIDEVWEGRAVSENVITVAMARLRKTLVPALAAEVLGKSDAAEREFIKNVHGRGYRFVHAVAERSAPLSALPPSEARVTSQAPFVGRSAALERLRPLLHQAAEGRGSLGMVLGEAGIGKTRLVEELAREAEAAGAAPVWAYCQAGHAPPLWPFEQLLRGLLERLQARGGDAALAEALAQLLAELSSARTPMRGVESLGHASPTSYDAAAKHRSFDAVARILTQLGNQSACVLVIDDLHWADAATLELLRFWADRAARSRVLLLGTLRDPGAGEKSRPLGEVLGHRNCQRIELGRLDETDVHSYVRSLLPDADPLLSRAILHKSDGNPFFMVELTRALREAPQAQVEQLRVPDAALSLLRQRVLALDDAARGVLSRAAVVGRSFELGLLSQVLEQEPRAVMQHLDAAIASAVVAPVRDSKTEFAFGHELLRDVLYQSISPAELRACHLRVALLLEQRLEAGVPQPMSLLAHHFYSALPDSDPRKAVRYTVLAAESAIHGYAYADAVQALGRAREALGLVPNPSIRLSLALLTRQALCARVCRAEEFERLVRELIELAREQRAGEVLAQATLLLCPHPGFAGVVGAGAALREALSVLTPEQEALRAALCARLATLGPLAFDGAESRVQVEQAYQLARSSSVLLGQHSTCLSRVYAMGSPDHADAAEESAEQLLSLCRDNPQQLSVPPVLLDLDQAIRALQEGELARAVQALERAEQRARMLDSQELLWQAQRSRALLRVNQGQVPDSIGALEPLHQRGLRDAILGAPLLVLHDRSVIAGRRAPLSASERAWLAPDPDDPPVRWSIKLRVLSRLGLRAEALSALHRVSPAALAGLPCDRDYLGTLGSVARAVLELSTEAAYAEALVTLLERYPRHFAVHSSFLCEGAVPELLGLLQLRLGHPREAQRQLEVAVQRSEAAGLTRCAAEARLALALAREAVHEH